MKECFSFREMASQPAHDHRLMYLHSSPCPASLPYNSCQRMRTMLDEPERQTIACKSLRNKIQRHLQSKDKKFYTAPMRTASSQKEIKYFKLDLTKIINSNQLSQFNHSYLNHCDNNQKKKPGYQGSFKNQINKIDEQNIIDKNKHINKLSGILNEVNLASKNMEKILNNNLTEMQNMYSQGKLKQNIKVNTLYANNKDFNDKYSNLRKHYSKHPKIIKPSQFFQKSVKRSEIREQLQLKRLEKIVINKSGHQFRITIQKIN